MIVNYMENYKQKIPQRLKNVNVGYNEILMERCRQLNDYAQFVNEVRKRLKKENVLVRGSKRSSRRLHPKRNPCRVPEQKPRGGGQSEYL